MPKPPYLPRCSSRPHPSVDLGDFKYKNEGKKKEIVHGVTCPGCGAKRYFSLCAIKAEIRKGNFTGNCRKCFESSRPRCNYSLYPHPSVNWDMMRDKWYKHRECVRQALVTCPCCSRELYKPADKIKQDIEAGEFTGACRSCYTKVWGKYKGCTYLSLGRVLNEQGYVTVSLKGVLPYQMAIWEQMRGRKNYVLEHRLVMGVHLGRPLTKNELIDHMNGIKTDNAVGNLRIYRKGKNDPGSHCGYGTFYHELQVALARVKELEMQLALASSLQANTSLT